MQKNKKEKAKKFHKEINEERRRKYGIKKTCKGGKEHDWLLTIPDYLCGGLDITPKMINGYYKIQEKEHNFSIEMDKEYEKIGMKKTKSFLRSWKQTYKYYICSVCGKKDYR